MSRNTDNALFKTTQTLQHQEEMPDKTLTPLVEVVSKFKMMLGLCSQGLQDLLNRVRDLLLLTQREVVALWQWLDSTWL